MNERSTGRRIRSRAGWRARAAALAVAVLTAVGVGVVAAPAQAYYTNSAHDFRVLTHVQNKGWTSTPGTRGAGLRLEAIRVTQLQHKVICLNAHVANIGWQGKRCTSGKGTTITVGTTGRDLAIEAVTLTRPGNTYGMTATVHIQNVGDKTIGVGKGIGGFTVGTTGKRLRMEWFELKTS
ncbi:hypothetical protein ACFWHT_14210 [Microbacterium sp. NPDC058342]|uniref:hypothetical protein n=1 Tax=Microbacterium sp. NPDC058342 TaxID=3346454 RepID=UPI0036572E09